MPAPHRVVIVAFPGIEPLDATGPAEVRAIASSVARGSWPGCLGQIATAGGPRLALLW